MKRAIYFICYLLAFCIGILLLILNRQASSTDSAGHVLFIDIFIGLGVAFIIPGISILFINLFSRKKKGTDKEPVSWTSTLTGIISLIWGVLILIMPGGMFGNMNITLGVSTIILAGAQMSWIYKGKQNNRTPLWLYIIPVIVGIAGVVVLMLRKDYQNPGKELEIGYIITGISLLFWGINGLLSLRRCRNTESTPSGINNKVNDSAL